MKVEKRGELKAEQCGMAGSAGQCRGGAHRVVRALVGLGVRAGRDIIVVMGRPGGLGVELIVPAVPVSARKKVILCSLSE